MEEEKKIKEENEQRYYIALAIALGVASASDVDPSKPVPAAVKEAVDTKLASAGLLPSEITGEERLSEQQIVQKAAAVA